MAGQDSYIERLRSVSSINDGSVANVVPKAMLIPVVAFFTSLANAIGAAFGVPIATFDGLAKGAQELIRGLFGVGSILDAGATASAQSFTSGPWAQFGPFSFVIAVGVVGLAALVLARARENPSTGNVVAYLPFDVPFIGTDEEEK